jgi:hypothetical protein
LGAEASRNDNSRNLRNDLVDGKRRVLFNFAREFWKRNQDDNLNELARKWGFPSGGGHFPGYVNELAETGYLKRFAKNEKSYIRITAKGEIAILPLILPKLLILFNLVVSVVLVDEAILSKAGHASLLPDYILTIGFVLLIFSLIGFYMLNRMEKFLLKLA